MKVLGVVCHSLKSVKAHLDSQELPYSVYPDVDGKVVLTVTVEQMLLAMKKCITAGRTKARILVMDVPTHLNGMHIDFVGAQAMPGGIYFRVPLAINKATEFSDYVLDKKLRAVNLAIKNVKRYVLNKSKAEK